MAVRTRQQASGNTWQRFAGAWRAFFAQGDLTTLIITLALLAMPALSLFAAGWPLDMRTLAPVLVLSIVFGFLLARSYYNELLALFMSGIYGACFVLIIAAINEPGGIGEGVFSVFTRLFQWLVDATTGGINQDELVFTLLVAGLFWFLGYNIAWHVFRIDRVWRAILPPGLILITNAVYYTGDANLDWYIVIFMFLSLLLIVRSNLDAREWDWYVNGIRVPRRLRRQFLRVGAMLSLVALLVGWGVPSGDLQERLDNFQEFLQTEPLQQLSEIWNRLFTSIETQGPTTTDYYGGDSLQLGGAIRLGEQEVFWVEAPPGRRYYWRSRVFSNYDRGRWTSAADTRLTDPDSPLEIVPEPYVAGAREPVTQEFTMGLSASRIIYTAPQPSRVELPTRTDLRYMADGSMSVSVIRPLRVIYRGETYTNTSLMSTASAADLRAASTAYPEDVASIYLPYSPTVTPRTLQLARQIVTEAGAVTPYDQAKAIETWLRANIAYNEQIPQPPADRDPVDWVLFDLREGYCNYYSSAMVVMLRSLGIPARMAAGFAQGEFDAASGRYVVRERDAHTWVEAYFPGYGWIEFEPTAAQAPIDRGDENQPDAQAATIPPPEPSDTPTPTITPSPSATAGVPTIAPEPESNELPTVTPSFTPTLTPTPVIVPTQPPPLNPPPQSPMALLLPAIGVLLGTLLLIALVIALLYFTYWWWEWRGLKGLSPVTRAWARLERYLSLIGLTLSREDTPEERRRRIVRVLPPRAEPPVTTLAQLYTTERYGPGADPQHPSDDAISSQVADRAWKDTRQTILGRFLRKFRFWRRRDAD